MSRLPSIQYARLCDDSSRSVFDLWEEGAIRAELSTPAVWSREYRDLAISLVLRHHRRSGLAISLGCGNGFIEGELRARGITFFGLDRETRAAILAKSRSAATLVGDAEALPVRSESVELLFADGLLGHLWRSDEGFQPFLAEARRALVTGGVAILSNDLSDGNEVSLKVTADSRARFFRGPQGYVRQQLMKVKGLVPLQEYVWRYLRPGRGLRDREILVFRREF